MNELFDWFDRVATWVTDKVIYPALYYYAVICLVWMALVLLAVGVALGANTASEKFGLTLADPLFYVFPVFGLIVAFLVICFFIRDRGDGVQTTVLRGRPLIVINRKKRGGK